MTLYPTYSKRVSMSRITSSKTFGGLHPKMRDRIQRLMEASGGKVGLGQGLRDPKQQLQLFLSRHYVDPNGKYSYDGKKWSRHQGVAAAVPPGRSMHEIGLAADLVGDMGWVRDNAARFDLQTFEHVNNEPWHVQPTELPRGRSSYQRDPEWGMPPWDGAGGADASPSTPGGSASGGAAAGGALTPALRARPGDTGPAATVMIEALIARELLADADASRDGSYDQADRQIVEDFQRSGNLVVDGIVGPQTWGALLTEVLPGDTGPHVRVLQVTLIVRGMIRDTAGNRDGVYGSATQDVIRQFQTLAALRPDREVGPKTWTALIGEKKRIQVSSGPDVLGGSADDEVDEDEEFDLDDIDILAVMEGRAGE
ncbi:MAG: peptidoglycan-binding protein [Ilumatobacter sp.]|uniref:peptidoglycan-binding protein n=1 Tax=Ilumatobacter sp. TaxID=1967498 RepID=UPI0026108930|nr:peptidoglycan-binding protein [Ilumatobacter sp.]MDJ0770575.1 peptidoglycan-binding protein [Ilumatobacter sp.]